MTMTPAKSWFWIELEEVLHCGMKLQHEITVVTFLQSKRHSKRELKREQDDFFLCMILKPYTELKGLKNGRGLENLL